MWAHTNMCRQVRLAALKARGGRAAAGEGAAGGREGAPLQVCAVLLAQCEHLSHACAAEAMQCVL